MPDSTNAPSWVLSLHFEEWRYLVRLPHAPRRVFTTPTFWPLLQNRFYSVHFSDGPGSWVDTAVEPLLSPLTAILLATPDALTARIPYV